MHNKQYLIKSTEDYNNIVLNYRLELYSIIILSGQCGSGKTSFIKYIVEKYYNEDFLGSPSFNLANTYNNLIHADLYLAKNQHAIKLLLLSLSESNKPIFIEWGEKAHPYLSLWPKILYMQFECDKNQYKIYLKNYL